MDITLKSTKLIHTRTIKSFTLMVGGKEIVVEKYWEETMNDQPESGYGIENEKEIKELLGEDWNNLTIFIDTLK